MNLLAELLNETGLLNTAMTPGGGASGNGYTIAATNPRILFNNATFAAKMAAAAAANTTAYSRIKNISDTRFRVTASLQCSYYDALMYQITKNETYAQYAYDEVMKWLVSEETKIANQTPTTVEFDSYLYIGPAFQELMLSYDWCSHKFSESEKQRLFAYVNQGLQNMIDPPNAMWGTRNAPWTGWAINNPTNNYFYSRFMAFTCVALGSFGANDRAAEWLDYVTTNRVPLLTTELSTMVPEGGSLEGTNYGLSLSSYWNSFWIWKTSANYTFFDDNMFAKSTIHWYLHNLSPEGKYWLASGDQSTYAAALWADSGRVNFVSLMALYPSDLGCRAAKTVLQNHGHTQAFFSAYYFADLMLSESDILAADPSILNKTYLNQKVGMSSYRTSWGQNATWVTQQVGVLYESHQHLVNGGFDVYKNEWLFDTHSRRTTNGLYAHPAATSCARFEADATVDANGVPLTTILESGTVRNGNAYPTYYPYYTAYYNDSAIWYSEANLKDAFWDKAEIVKDRRCLLHLKNPSTENLTIICFDELESLNVGTNKVFQLNMGYQPSITGSTFTINNTFTAAKVFSADDTGAGWTLVNYPVGGLSAAAGYRMERRISNNKRANFLNVIDVGLEISSITPTSGPASKNLTINFTDGRVATISFSNASPGGSLTYTSTTGATLYNDVLPTVVNSYGYTV